MLKILRLLLLQTPLQRILERNAMILNKLVFVPLLLGFSVAHAGQFASIIDAMAIESTADYTNKEWKDTQRIKGVKWRWPHHESGAHHSTMKGTAKVGKDRNPNIGTTEVLVDGTRTMINRINISVANNRKAADLGLLGPGQANRISTSCDMDYASEVNRFYEFKKPGYKPLYINYAESWGASGESGSVQFTIAYRLEDVIDSPGCKVVQ